jgi:hypothetical protein
MMLNFREAPQQSLINMTITKNTKVLMYIYLFNIFKIIYKNNQGQICYTIY